MSDWVKTQDGWKQTGGNGVSQEEVDRVKADLTNKVDKTTKVNNKALSSDITLALSDLTADATHRVVTDAEKTAWNGKMTVTRVTTGKAFSVANLKEALVPLAEPNLISAYIIFTNAEYEFIGRVMSSGSIRGMAIYWSDSKMYEVYCNASNALTMTEVVDEDDITTKQVTDFNLTTTNAIISDVWLAISGKTAQLTISYQPKATWSRGGTLNMTIDKYKPKYNVTGVTYLGSNGGVAQLRSNGSIDIRNITGDIATGSNLVVTFTYLLA